jgi:hypothetical protein
MIRSDPVDRCSATLFYGDKLAVLPFRTDEVRDDVPRSCVPSAERVPCAGQS